MDETINVITQRYKIGIQLKFNYAYCNNHGEASYLHELKT
jgi:hypothetical protein